MSSSTLARVSHYLGIKLRDSIVFILITVSLVGGGSYLYAAWTNITPTQTQSGAPVTQSLMDAIRTNLDDLNTRVSSVSGVPAGFVGSFNLLVCPTGWIAADGNNGTIDLRGEFIRGLDTVGAVDPGRTLGSWQNYGIQSHTHIVKQIGAINIIGGSMNVYGPDGVWADLTSDVYGGSSSETRPRNRALLYCQKS